MMGFRSGLKWVAACLVGTGLLWGGAAAQGVEEEGAAFPRIACLHGITLRPEGDGGTLSTGESLSVAEIARYDLVMGINGPWADKASWPLLREKLSLLRKANPNMVIIGPQLQVESAYADPNDVPAGVVWRKPPDDAWLADTNGKRLPGSQPGVFWLNLRQPDVLEWLLQGCKADVQERGFDGMLLGGMGASFPDWNLSRILPGYTADTDGDGIADEQDDLKFLWQDAKRKLCEDVRDKLGHKVVIIAAGTPQTDFIYENFNGWCTGTPLLELRRGNTQWEYEYDRYVSWTETPHRPHTTLWVSIPDPTAPPETAEVTAQRMRFGLAATLMADGYFGCTVQDNKEAWFPEFAAPLGHPLGPAHMGEGTLWQRGFQGGIVVLNPAAEPAAAVFETAYRDFSTGTAGKVFTIPGKDGRIFVPAE